MLNTKISTDQNAGLSSAYSISGTLNPRQLSKIKYVRAGWGHGEDSEFPENVFLWASYPPHPKGIIASFVTWGLVGGGGALTSSLKNMVYGHYTLGNIWPKNSWG